MGDTVSDFGDELVQFIPQLRRYAYALTSNATDADDLVQECLTRTLAKCPSWQKVRNPRTYLFSVMHNAYVDKATSNRGGTTEIDIESVRSAHQSPSATIDRLALRDLETALQKLPSKQREVVLLVGLEGMNYREAAEVLKVPLGTVMSRLSRGREALRELMDGHTHQPMKLAK